MSYVIDVYRGTAHVQNNPLTLMTYVSMFPQLIAGPIVRYETVERELKTRTINYEGFKKGTIRFLVGLLRRFLLPIILVSFGIILIVQILEKFLLVLLGLVL